MAPLLAQIDCTSTGRDDRAAPRRTLRLSVPTGPAADATEALIHNLSERGLLVETTVALDLGDTLYVELPEAGSTPARVVWLKDKFAGCEFVAPVAKAAVSAALLQSPVEGATLTRRALPRAAS